MDNPAEVIVPSQPNQPLQPKKRTRTPRIQKKAPTELKPSLESAESSLTSVQEAITSNQHEHPAHAKNNKPCETCGQKQKKPRKVSVPTQKQLDSRKAFAAKVAAAKQLQTQEAGLKYKDAIKRVYAVPK